MTKSKKTAKIKSRKETNKQKKEIKTKERKIMENQNSSFQYWMPVRILFTEAEPDLREEIAGESIVIVTDPFLYESGVQGTDWEMQTFPIFQRLSRIHRQIQ